MIAPKRVCCKIVAVLEALVLLDLFNLGEVLRVARIDVKDRENLDSLERH